jgi:hypothetical protein
VPEGLEQWAAPVSALLVKALSKAGRVRRREPDECPTAFWLTACTCLIVRSLVTCVGITATPFFYCNEFSNSTSNTEFRWICVEHVLYILLCFLTSSSSVIINSQNKFFDCCIRSVHLRKHETLLRLLETEQIDYFGGLQAHINIVALLGPRPVSCQFSPEMNLWAE